MPKTITSVVTFNVTASADAPFNVCAGQSIPFYDANFHIATQAAQYGDMTAQDAPAAVGDVISYRNGDLKDIWFKNAAAGVNTQIICVAVVPVDYVKEALGL